MSKRKDVEPEVTFEVALRKLEQVVSDLERGDAGLSEALTKYEEGVRLLGQCQGILDRAERSVSLLIGVDPSGQADTVPFGDEATAG